MSLPRAALRRALRWYARRAAGVPGRARIIDLARGRDADRGAELQSEIAPGLWMWLDLGSHVERQLYYDGFYRSRLLGHFLALLAPGQTVVDVGANVGPHTLFAARAVGPGGLVIAYEPEGRCFARLVKNLELNHMVQVRARRLALADRAGEVELHVNAPDHPNQAQSSLARLDVHADATRVRCERLDDALASEEVSRVDVLKLDAQGAEALVLRGAPDLLARDHPAILVRTCEHLCNSLETSTLEVQRTLLDHGYDLTRIDPGPPSRITRPRPEPDATFVARRV